jgi:hypothetical protein
MPNPDLFRILGHASLRLAVMIASGNRGSRFLYARVSCLWKTRCSKCRLAQISCHASYQDQRLRSFPRDFATYPVRVSCPREFRFPDVSNADGARSLTPVPPMDGPDLIVVSRLEWPRCLVPLDLRDGRSRDTCPSPTGRLRFSLGISRLSKSCFSCSQDLRFPDSRLFGISCHVSLGSTAYDGVGNSRIAVSYCKGSCP